VNLRHDTVAVVDFLLVQADAFDAMLVGPGVQGFFIDLPGLVDLQLGRTHLLHDRQADVAHGQDVRGRQIRQHVLEDMALGAGQLVVIVVHVLRHADFQRRPVVAVGFQEELPGPGVLERRQLVDVGLAIDDALVGRIDRGQPQWNARRGGYLEPSSLARGARHRPCCLRGCWHRPCWSGTGKSQSSKTERAHWQASHSGLSMLQNLGSSCGMAIVPPARLFGLAGAQRAQVVGGLQAAHPGQLVDFVEFLAGWQRQDRGLSDCAWSIHFCRRAAASMSQVGSISKAVA
jgi:hypothetical protein